MQIRLIYAKKAQASTGLKCNGHKAVTIFFAIVFGFFLDICPFLLIPRITIIGSDDVQLYT